AAPAGPAPTTATSHMEDKIATPTRQYYHQYSMCKWTKFTMRPKLFLSFLAKGPIAFHETVD
ncbi:MAG TPA: hypothetical protein VGE97_04825, partial [Nitrososphaera sp.]